MDITNKSLAILIVIAVVITLVGTFYSINKVSRFATVTGYGTSGYVNVTITTKTELNVTQPDCTFGSGYVDAGKTYAILASNDTKSDWTNTTAFDPSHIEVRNVGNTNVTVNVSSGKTAQSFMGGTSPEYKVWSLDKDVGACSSGLVTYPGTNMDTTNVTVCSKLHCATAIDEMYVGCYIKVPDSAPAAAKTDTWTFTVVAAA